MGWDEKFLQSAVDTCRSESGRIEDCPLFTLQSEDKMNQCEIPTEKNNLLASVFKEKVKDNMNSLPGNVQIKAGPGYAKGAAPAQSKPIESAEVPTLSHSDAPTVAPSDGYLPGAVLQETVSDNKPAPSPAAPASSAEVNIAAAPPAPTTTPPPAPPNPAAKSQSYFSTEYVTKGREVVEVLWVEELVTVTAGSTTTMTVLAKERKRHLHKHRRGGIQH
jgi:hypothetical protein